jgi:ABC-2 type transport system ATP-binding protein
MVLANDSPAIEATGLTKTYGKDVRALDGLDLTVAQGTIHALLGPNGAGKSTTVKIVTTLSRPDGGTAKVLGVDVVKEAEKVRRSIGVVGQNGAVDPEATGRENMMLQGAMYGMGGKQLRSRVDSLLTAFGLAEPAGRIVKTWSGGQRRKLDVATGLVHEPRVLFLDEPTTGLDPEARSELWAEVRRLNAEGLTILLTTHYLEEADQLASEVAIIDRGKIVASGAPDELKSALNGDSIVLELADTNGAALNGRLTGALRSIGELSEPVVEGRIVRARVGNGARSVPTILSALDAAGISVASVTVARPSLDDVYLQHTGRAYVAQNQEASL